MRSNDEGTVISDYAEPDSQPIPIDGEGGGIDVGLCGNLIPMYVCMRGAGGGSNPDDMLTQPGHGGSILGSGEAIDLGREAVTNTGDGSFSTTDSQGHGSGGGGSGMDWRNPGDPDEPAG